MKKLVYTLPILFLAPVIKPIDTRFQEKIDTRSPQDKETTRQRAGLKAEQFHQEDEIRNELFKRKQKKSNLTQQPTMDFETWIQADRNNVVLPSYDNGTKTPFHKAVETGNSYVGDLTIAAAKKHGVSSDELLQPLKNQYDLLTQHTPTKAQHLITQIDAMGNARISQKFREHTIISDLKRTINSVKPRSWNINTGQDEVQTKQLYTKNLPISKMDMIIRTAISHNIPLQKLLDAFPNPEVKDIANPYDPQLQKELVKRQQKSAQRLIIKKLYNEAVSNQRYQRKANPLPWI